MKTRTQSKRTVRVGKTTFGGEKLVACVPVVSRDEPSLYRDLQTVCARKPDLIEWRIDYFAPVDDPARLEETARRVGEIAGEIPVLLTFRALPEGGERDSTPEERERVIRTVCATGVIQAVDIELDSTPEFLSAMRDFTAERGIKLILSWHNIHETPHCDFMVARLLEEEAKGADIAKLSVQPNSFHDVVTLLTACARAREQLSIPQIVVSKDDIGVITRILGQYLGSDLTFFSVAGSSTIGQVSLEDYRALETLLQLD